MSRPVLLDSLEFHLAKISDLSDAQLEKAFLKYQARFKIKQDDELRNILRQLRAEQGKRGISVPLLQKAVRSAPARRPSEMADDTTEKTEITLLSEVADRAVSRKLQNQTRNKVTQRVRVVREPRLSRPVTNSMLGGGLLLGFSGALLLADYFFLGWLSPFRHAALCYGAIAFVGIGLSKAAMSLSDDNT